MAQVTYLAVRASLTPGIVKTPFIADDPPPAEPPVDKPSIENPIDVEPPPPPQPPPPATGWVNIELPVTPDIRSTDPDMAATLADFTETVDLKDLEKLIGISLSGEDFKNTYDKNPQLLLNAGRVIMNASTDYAMMFGAKGVIISSREDSIHLDAEKEVVFHGKDGVFIGLPGGDELKPPITKRPTNKGNPTVDNDYEPLVLGLKLMNWLDDLIQVLQQATVVGLTNSYFRQDTQENFRAIRARIPEMVSTYAFVDGISHEAPSKYTPTPGLQITVPPKILSGEFISGTPKAADELTEPTTVPATGPGAPSQIDGFFEENDNENPLVN